MKDRHLENGIQTVWVNDCDWDVCLALWFLRNSTRIVGARSEPLISRIVFNTDMMDTCAGAYPIDPGVPAPRNSLKVRCALKARKSLALSARV
jgi:hypothetical protein